MKFLLVFFFLLSFLFAGKIEIESLKFEAYDEKGITVFTGNVLIKKGLDRMHADNVTVYLDKDRQIERFEASGNTSFVFNFENNSTFVGSSDKFIYTPKNGEFKLLGSARISDIINSKEIIGEEVIFFEKTKVVKVLGAKMKPVRLIFDVEDSKK
ncbi:MAG: lipopolysaccharide export system protein LptA [Campylobacterota bacterium]|nr:lipopolysaccharide export system protein LptA [Campylobacterota bacterium]